MKTDTQAVEFRDPQLQELFAEELESVLGGDACRCAYGACSGPAIEIQPQPIQYP